MPQATFSIRMDEALKRQLDDLCSDFGMSTSTAFNIFAKAVVRERRIPFDIFSSARESNLTNGKNAFAALRAEARANGIQDMPLDEINAEIRGARLEQAGKAQ